jgi:hypothetical protein
MIFYSSRRSTLCRIHISPLTPVVNLKAEMLNETSARLRWQPSLGALKYRIERRSLQSASVVTVESEGPECVLHNIDGVEDVTVFAGATVFETKGQSISIASTLNSPLNVVVVDDEAGGIKLSWTGVAGAQFY